MSSVKSEVGIDVGGRLIPVEVRRYPKARTYRLRFDTRAGVLRLSMPHRSNMGKAIAWAQGQTEWVAKQLATASAPERLADGALFPLEGKNLRIRWSAAHPRTPRVEDDRLLVGGSVESVGARVQRWLKARAKLVMSAESHDMAEGAGLRVTSVAVGDPRSRWGSCSSTGVLRYSWRLILAPAEVRRATVAHEVAHLVHMDHSPAFHAAHAEILGEDPRPARAWLRRHGADLHRYIA